ncbi:MAG: VgrG-related protein [Anaerolineaceae bacterium]|nr:VgrG-related protein [Anaerolineaceae bacterium]
MTEEIKISINGTIQKDLIFDLVEMIVDTSTHMPSMFTLLIHDDEDLKTGNMKYTDSEIIKVGAAVKIEMSTDELPDESGVIKGELINGEITALEPVFSPGGTVNLRVRGYDKSHRLTRGKKTRTFLKMSDSDIVNKVASACGLSVVADSTSVKYDYVMQYNQTDWDFIWSRAKRIGYQIFSRDQKLYFSKADKELSGATASRLTWGLNLRRFEPRLSLIGQIDESSTISWDPNQKKSIEAKETGVVKIVPEIGLGKNSGGNLAKSTFSSPAPHFIADSPIQDTNEAKALATGQKILSESSFIQAEGECAFGDPRLVAGKMVQVDGVGKKFSGKYHVTEAQHHYSAGLYTVYFGVTGQLPNTIHSLLRTDKGNDTDRIDGVVSAIVTKINDDPKNMNRIQVKFPWLPKDNGAEVSSSWARLAMPNSGNGRGFFFMPEIDDEVLIAFEHGDINFPYVVGSLWNGKDKTPLSNAEAVKDGKVVKRTIKSRSGHIITLDDTDGKEKITIQDKTSKNSIVIDSSEKSMTIKAEGDLIFEAGGKFMVTSKGDVSFDSKAKTTLSSQMEFSVESKQKASFKAGPGELSLQLSGSSLKGTQVEVNGSAKTDVKTSGILTVQGSLVKIN